MNKSKLKFSKLTALAAFACLPSVHLSGAIIAVDFFNYGDSAGALSGLGSAGDGWAGAWGGSPNHHYIPTDGPITYTAPGYNNSLNPVGSGGLNRATGNAGNIVTREFSQSLTGTIWLSILQNRAANGADGLLWLNPTVDARNFVSIRNNNEPTLRYDNTNTTATGVGTGTHLLLARVQINASGNDDTVDFWVNPDLSGGLATLGTATISGTGSDALGNGLSSIGVSFGTNTSASMDALRVGSTLESVTAIPEPSTYAALFGLLALGFVAWRRRR